MPDQFNERYENQLRELAINRIQSGNFKVFDKDARIITRVDIRGKTNCLVIINKEGETLVFDPHFEIALKNALGFKR
jgi:hypothetical protein